jgi:nicotinamidase-related amidase
MERVLPVVLAISRRFPERTVFTRFITPNHPSDMPGTWRLYYEKWRETTRDQMDVRLLQLMPDLAKLAPPAMVIDKMRYSAFFEPFLLQHLRARQADGLVVTGSETDVCVLATIMSAVDHGYRVILVRDGV